MPDEDQVPATPANATPAEDDKELKAINAIVAALKPLQETERRSVLEYVLRRFGMVPLQAPVPQLGAAAAGMQPPALATPAVAANIHDIRTLKEVKAPKSANEMAALVAYYVSELAPEKKPEIDKGDIEQYFKSGGFKLTARAGQTLVNAKHAGYLDSGSGTGRYKLNPVGYNLVVHRLPSGGADDSQRRSSRDTKKTGKKSSRRKR